MPPLITDEMIESLALRGRWDELPRKVLEKYSGLLDRVSYLFSLHSREKRRWLARDDSRFQIAGSNLTDKVGPVEPRIGSNDSRSGATLSTAHYSAIEVYQLMVTAPPCWIRSRSSGVNVLISFLSS